MRKNTVSMLVVSLIAITLMFNQVHAYLFCPDDSELFVSHSSSEGFIVTSISGVKFYDANANGQRDEGEAGIEGWMIQLYKWMEKDDEGNWGWVLLQTVTTDINGQYIFYVSEGSYMVVEGPSVRTSARTTTVLEEWVQTAPEGGCHIVAATWGETYEGNDFGNVYLKYATGGRTMGFWGNKNGQLLISGEDIVELNELKLYRPIGWTYPQFKDKAEIKNYLRNANSVNMLWMLSAQLIATKLNVLHGFLDNSTIVYVGPSLYVPTGFITIGDILENAYNALSDTDRGAQEYWKNLLDGLNNNWLPFVCTQP